MAEDDAEKNAPIMLETQEMLQDWEAGKKCKRIVGHNERMGI